MDPPRILVAGVGNIFLGDDGFGSEVVRRLAGWPTPETVRVADYGIGGVHLAYDLLDGWELLILVDAVGRGGPAGSLSVLEVDGEHASGGPVDAHRMDPSAVFAGLRRLGGTLPRTLLVGCEPATTGEGIGLSPPVSAAVEPAATTVRELVARELERAAPSAGERR